MATSPTPFSMYLADMVKVYEGSNYDFEQLQLFAQQSWSEMADDAKRQYAIKLEQQKSIARISGEMKGKKDKGTGKKKEEGGGAEKEKKSKKKKEGPKRPLTAFFCFCNVKRQDVREMHPNISIGDTAKALGQMWRDLDKTAKIPYETMAAADKRRYEVEKEEFEKKKNQLE